MPRTTHSEELPRPYGLGAEDREPAAEPSAPEDEQPPSFAVPLTEATRDFSVPAAQAPGWGVQTREDRG